jgi:hypothetical protein
MLFGSDCKNNMLWDVTGIKRGDTVGLKEGEIRAEVRIIENLLREGMEWPAIERITGVNETHFQALKQRLEAMNQ